MTDAPIGIFSSDVGGLTVARTISDHRPRDRFPYLGGATHPPHGPGHAVGGRGPVSGSGTTAVTAHAYGAVLPTGALG